ncbi:toxin-antitoxin system YwqK family antitoxin [Reichenbachiella ulvae]|uniref:Membrane-binding protein n=1 Tax=Reichenbachiella ulvae TaxID=2980104 RepID=A0ABT3CZX8_9BACT|nr:membrane-binding protein [Reichenbachiella ulvae]MCV9389055.1 membrane-binding protein [Reichenbachiella ulvae]
MSRKRAFGTWIAYFLFIGSIWAQGVEVRTYYDQDQQVLKEVFYVNDTIENLLNGPYRSYYLSGKVKSEGEYQYNRATGDWVYYFENGNIRNTGSFFRGRSVGIWTYYFENGNKRSEGILEDNQRAGEWTFYFEDGGLKSEGTYLDGIRDGLWKFYYEEGSLKAQAIFKNGKGDYKEFYLSGSLKMEGLNRNGKSDSLWTYYFESGERMAEGYYKKGLKTGPWKYFYKNGEISAQGGYEEGQTIGNWIYYHENGAKSAEGLQKNSQKDGYWKMFYETGEMKGIGEFDEGTGEYNEYYVSGKLKVNGHFLNGLNDGHWTYFDEEGHIEGEADFEQGMGQYTGYYLDGSIKMSGKIAGGRRVGEWTLYKKNGEIAGKYHPVYQDDNPVFLTEERLNDGSNQEEYEKPEYKFKRKKSRNFTPVVNEYKGVIFATNPLMLFAGHAPLSVEYYLQERLGYELMYSYRRDPFFSSLEGVGTDDVFTQGHRLKFKQKFYSKDQKYGMLYFGHLIGANFDKHSVKINEGSGNFQTVSMGEQNYYYGVIVGDRWMKNPGNAGFTVDAYIGFGLGYRNKSRDYSDRNFDSSFKSVPGEGINVPVFFGVNIGYLGFKKYQTNGPVR